MTTAGKLAPMKGQIEKRDVVWAAGFIAIALIFVAAAVIF